MNKVCFGCGSKLQTDKPGVTGFIPVHKKVDSKYCQRCYKLIHYGEVAETKAPKQVKQIINNINQDHKFVLFLTDFLSINSEVIKIFKSIKTPKMFIISKSDIIPKSVNIANLKNTLKNEYGIKEDIKFVSSHTNYGVEALINYLDYRKINEAYIIGLSNAGKSNLINAMIDKLGSKTNKLTTSNSLNTTMDFIRIPLDEHLLLIDTPGFVLPSMEFKPFTIKAAIKPKVYQMKAGETLKIEDYAFGFSESTSVILYLPNEFKSAKYYKEVIFTDELRINDNEDIMINGLGFIQVKKSSNVKINGIDPQIIEVRKTLLGANHE